MANLQLRLILDDESGDIVYTGGTWTETNQVQWYAQTSNHLALASPAGSGNTFGSLSLVFEGTQVAFIGNTPTSSYSQFALVTIDGGPPINTTYGNVEPPAYVQWYQSPILSDGQHTIEINHLDGTAVDMVIITVGPSTDLSNKQVFVDDLDGSVQYSGSWVKDTSGFNAGTLPDGFPIGLTTHRSSTVGDSFTFRFTGTSVALYGIFSWTNLGLLSATYTLDGNPRSQSMSYPVNATSAEYVSASGEASNFVFYSDKTIPAGDHTLVVQITQAINMTFILDYITYAPSFATPASMPNLTAALAAALPSTPRSSAVVSASHATSSLSLSLSSTLAPASTASGKHAVQTTSTSNRAPIDAIVSGLVGGCALITLVTFFFCLRNKRPTKEFLRVEPFEFNPDGVSSTTHGYSSSTSLTPYSGLSWLADLKRGRGGVGSQMPLNDPMNSANDRPLVSVTRPVIRIDSLGAPAGRESSLGPPAYDALSPRGHESELGPSLSVPSVPIPPAGRSALVAHI